MRSRYDTIIVGAGSAGCALASRLTEDEDRHVLLIEAGPDYATVDELPDELRLGNNMWDCMQGVHSWSYPASTGGPRPRSFVVPRGKVVGGSSAINGQVMYRGLCEDFDAWSATGIKGWTFEEVLPYFKKFERDLDIEAEYHGTGGPIPIHHYAREEWLAHTEAFYTACRNAGFPHDPDPNAPSGEGVGPRAVNNLDGLRYSAAIGYLTPARERPNLRILDKRLVTRINFDGRRAVGVTCKVGRNTETFTADEIILSAGAIGTPQLLLLSGVGPADDLRRLGITSVHDLPGVGKNLRDHPAVFMLFEADGLPNDPQAPPVQVGLRCRLPESSDRNELQMSPVLMSSEHRPLGVLVADASSHFGICVALQNARTAGTVTLASSDPTEPPLLDYNYLSDDWDLTRMRRGIRLAAQLAADAAFKDIIRSRVFPTDDVLDSDAELDTWIYANVQSQHHAAGTCKMGPATDPLAVVDEQCRVHGLTNLRVIDASIQPDVVRANPHATVLMTAEKLADCIRGRAPQALGMR